MEERGVLDKLKKTRQACRQIFTYAVITGRAEFNPVADLAGALKPPKQQHFPHLLPDQIGPFIHAVNAYSGSRVTRIATLLLMYTSVRTIELRAAEWPEFDFRKELWQIPKERMKMRRPHLVPLSRQAKSLLLELQEITGRGKYVFPGRNDAGKPISEASINQVIKRIGYAGQATGHGFRHTMSTVLHEKDFNSAWIEAQLAHADRNTIRGTYNHAQYLDGRRDMLQWYADYLDELATEVVG
jgi:integrase